MIEPVPAQSGKAYWRSLDQLADSPRFRDWVERRFPQSMRELLSGVVDRRQFLQLMAASLGLAGLAGCRRPEMKALPYSKPPLEIVPGLPDFYATAIPLRGASFPVLVETHEGRPTKIEGNPRHPDSGGSSGALAQACVLDLYDPDRGGPVLQKGQPASWQDYDAFASKHYAAIRQRKGKGLRILAEDLSSPSLDLLRHHFQSVLPESRWHVHDAVGWTGRHDGASIAFGGPFVPRYEFDRAEIIVSLDSDFLGLEEDGTRHHRGFAQGRLKEGKVPRMSRLYVVESQLSITGGMADHRLRLPSSHVPEFTLALARELLLGEKVVPAPGSPQATLRQALASFRPALKFDPRWIREVAADLRAHAGKGIVIAGRRQPAQVHALVFALNAFLGNLGKTIELRNPPARPPSATLQELVAAIDQNQVQTLLILGSNPVYTAPVDLDFADKLQRVPTTIRLGLHADETSRLATWHLPAAHALEAWGDARAGDGAILAVQPMIAPLFDGRNMLEELARLSKYEPASAYEIARRAFREESGVTEANFEAEWRKFLHEGTYVHEGTHAGAYPVEKPSLHWDAVARAVASYRPSSALLSATNLELVLERDAKVDDGRFANNGWLQELPNVMTKLAWGNAALLSPTTARELGVTDGDLVRLEQGGRSLEIVAMVLPGQADYSVGVALGYGRSACGRVGQDVGSNAYVLRTSQAPDVVTGLKITPLGRQAVLATTQEHYTMEGREVIRELTLADLLARSIDDKHAPEEELPDIQTPPRDQGDHQWGMAIDLNTCTGCSACVLACQSENNIPIVGKDEVPRGRSMHWIRIDRYFSGDLEEPDVVHQPVACVQCEKAPCELVCPVNATVHGEEGLNIMVYSRCIGTRYCSNNCPYKVRRFNYFNYNERPLDKLWYGPLAEWGMAETLKMQKNPDVSVRTRGVMEKCTYCVQRIERARIGTHVAAGDAPPGKIPDGTVVPACAQACPAQAIVFGDLSDPHSRVSRIKNQARNYDLLGELNTKPRTSHLARLRNPNPRMLSGGTPAGGAHA
ncbi:MAG: TAT-variant-translocated molybdopterin oxidoreductase [Isosphaeraceae bacterium]